MEPSTNSQPNSNSQDPYLILGINEGASFDAIQEARDKKLIEAGDAQIEKAKIEAAYDALLMVSLKSRQLGNASNDAINASKKENEVKKVGDMGTGSWIMSGPVSGQNQAFGSSCHGAGRSLSRTKAKKMIDGKALKKKLESSGIRIHASTPNVLSEEAPDAYKDVDEVIELTAKAGLARPVARIKPNIVVKG